MTVKRLVRRSTDSGYLYLRQVVHPGGRLRRTWVISVDEATEFSFIRAWYLAEKYKSRHMEPLDVEVVSPGELRL